MLSSKCNVKIKLSTSTTDLLATEPGTQPALCLCSILGDFAVEPVNSSVEVLTGLAGILLTPCFGLVPLLLSLYTERVVLGLGLGAVLLSLILCIAADLLGFVLCLLAVCPKVGFGLLCLSASAVRLSRVSTCSADGHE